MNTSICDSQFTLSGGKSIKRILTSLQQIRRMIRAVDLFAVKVGRKYRVPLSTLEEFLEDG